MANFPAMRREDYDEEWIGVALSRLVIPEDRTQCWGWRGVLSGQKGYPAFARWTSRFHNGWNRKQRAPKLVRIHRLMYVTEVGPIEKGMVIDHLCNNPTCCNPAHLEMTTHRNNLLRAGHTWAGRNSRKAACPKCSGPWSERSKENSKYRGRYCRECFNEYKRGKRSQYAEHNRAYKKAHRQKLTGAE